MIMQRNARVFELSVSIFLFALSGYLFYVALTTGRPASGGMSSMDFPKAILAVMMLASAVLIGRAVLWFIKNPKGSSKEAAAPLLPKKAVLTFALICVYAMLWKVLGFFLSSFFFFTVEAKMLDNERPLPMVTLIGFSAAVLMVLVFGVMFKVQFPEPLLELIRGY